MTSTAETPEVVDEHESMDFDAFWAAHGQRETVRILGEDVPVPTDVPLWLVMRANQTSTHDDAELRAMVAELFGDDQLDRWIEQGMGAKRLSVLIAWSIARAQGTRLTFAEAAERVEQVKANPPANRADRRKKGKTKR